MHKSKNSPFPSASSSSRPSSPRWSSSPAAEANPRPTASASWSPSPAPARPMAPSPSSPSRWPWTRSTLLAASMVAFGIRRRGLQMQRHARRRAPRRGGWRGPLLGPGQQPRHRQCLIVLSELKKPPSNKGNRRRLPTRGRGQVSFNGTTIDYEVRRSPRRKKTLEMRLIPRGQSSSPPPPVPPTTQIRDIVLNRAPWIVKRMAELPVKNR